MTDQYRTPGVYFETIDPAPTKITEVRSDIAGFVGVADRGPLHWPVKVESWTQFQTRFGGQSAAGYLAYAVYGFFANGGRTCWIVRVGDPDPSARRAALLFVNRSGQEVLLVEALDPGPGSEEIRVRIEKGTGGRFSLLVRLDGKTVETWSNLSMDPGDPRNVECLVNDGSVRSVLIQAVDVSNGALDAQPVMVSPMSADDKEVEGSLGRDGRASPVLANLKLAHFTGENAPQGTAWGLACLEVIEEVSLVAMPDLMWPGEAAPTVPPPASPNCRFLGSSMSNPPPAPAAEPRAALSDDDRLEGQLALLRHCAKLHDRFAVLDTPWGLTADAAAAYAGELRCGAGQFAGLYYPWLAASDPLQLDGDQRWIPPSGYVAGMAARVDLSVGVQKPPANERLEGVFAVAEDVDDVAHGELNDAAVNVIRAYPGRGVRVMGARTLTDDAQWLFVNVRRLLLVIEQSIDRATQWVVFQPNNPQRWNELERVVRNFLDDEWRQGRLDGATAGDAYSVTCDETTNPSTSLDDGQLNCLIGVLPPQPAEFVVVRLGRTADQTGSGGEGRDAGASDSQP